MRHEFPWARASAAAKGLALGMLLTMASFGFVMYGTGAFLEHHVPVGVEAYAFAGGGTFPILCMLFQIGLYLRKETDEFQRAVMVRSLLWAIGIALVMNFYVGTLEGLRVIENFPPFAEFAMFFVAFGLVQLVQVVRNRVRHDE
jgi:hypothetical protein